MADDSTIENRVYLFKDLAAAWLAAHPSGLGAVDPAERARARAALAEIGRISCIVAVRWCSAVWVNLLVRFDSRLAVSWAVGR